MGGLKSKIQEDLKEAVKGKREAERLTLRGVLASIQSKEKERRYVLSKKDLLEDKLSEESSLTEEEVAEVISSEAKKRKESIEEYKKGKREDLVEQEKKELSILEKYLPEQISDEELENIIKEAIEKTGAGSVKDTGRVMAEVMPGLKGRAEGERVSRKVKEILS